MDFAFNCSDNAADVAPIALRFTFKGRSVRTEHSPLFFGMRNGDSIVASLDLSAQLVQSTPPKASAVKSPVAPAPATTAAAAAVASSGGKGVDVEESKSIVSVSSSSSVKQPQQKSVESNGTNVKHPISRGSATTTKDSSSDEGEAGDRRDVAFSTKRRRIENNPASSASAQSATPLNLKRPVNAAASQQSLSQQRPMTKPIVAKQEVVDLSADQIALLGQADTESESEIESVSESGDNPQSDPKATPSGTRPTANTRTGSEPAEAEYVESASETEPEPEQKQGQEQEQEQEQEHEPVAEAIGESDSETEPESDEEAKAEVEPEVEPLPKSPTPSSSSRTQPTQELQKVREADTVKPAAHIPTQYSTSSAPSRTAAISNHNPMPTGAVASVYRTIILNNDPKNNGAGSLKFLFTRNLTSNSNSKTTSATRHTLCISAQPDANLRTLFTAYAKE